MTREEFMSGSPFRFPGDTEAYKYDETHGGELMLLVNGEWHYAAAVSDIGETTFTVYAVRINGNVKRNYKTPYEYLIPFVLTF